MAQHGHCELISDISVSLRCLSSIWLVQLLLFSFTLHITKTGLFANKSALIHQSKAKGVQKSHGLAFPLLSGLVLVKTIKKEYRQVLCFQSPAIAIDVILGNYLRVEILDQTNGWIFHQWSLLYSRGH